MKAKLEVNAMRMELISRPGVPPVIIGKAEDIDLLSRVGLDESGQRLEMRMDGGLDTRYVSVNAEMAEAFRAAEYAYLVAMDTGEVVSAFSIRIGQAAIPQPLDEDGIGEVADMLGDADFLVTAVEEPPA